MEHCTFSEAISPWTGKNSCGDKFDQESGASQYHSFQGCLVSRGL